MEARGVTGDNGVFDRNTLRGVETGSGQLHGRGRHIWYTLKDSWRLTQDLRAGFLSPRSGSGSAW